ncbi:hypothetical protein ACTQ2N_07855 [Ruminococcus sp. LCP21S3_E8]
MFNCNEIKIDGYSIYVEQLKQLDTNTNMHDVVNVGSKAINWASSEIEESMKPIVSIWNSLQNTAMESMPNEMELSMQFEICLKGGTPVLKIVSAESSAQIAIKFSWKKDK